ncbi:PAP2 superfamily protein [Edaphobacter aggregans]|uniref:PAP2 superfamily protein n=1 Tax=Edaphobacter aggregans TaxID=570835 RepID=A0A3R9P0F1_9BACT|nr:vanadium-dependent haloperoxidase [Edaphobacter aggregans]RSL19088.1 PAP2 superfamily protein [Edaphobacter aggregans]
MKKIHGDTKNRVLGLCMLIATLFGSAVAKADVVLDWNVIAVNTAVTNGQNPFAQARYAAIVQLAVFESVNAITGEYRPYLGTIVAPAGACPEASAIQAAYRVLSTYFPASASTLLTARANSLALIPDGQAKSDGIATGDAAALAMIALRANDGSSPAQFKIPGPAVPGEYQATPSCPFVNGIAVGILFQWQNLTPFGIPSVSEFLLDPPPALDSNQYAKTYNEVKAVGSASANSTERPQDRADVVLYYAASSPTQVFNQAARQVVAEEGWHSLSENARAFALINMALSDGAVTTFFNKYHYNFWRPETAIHAGDTDGNRKTDADPNWVPFIPAPCFPSYPSAHGTLSGAGAEVMRRLYGEAGHAITLSNPAVPTIVLHYGSFRQITDDISDARVYGGIHFRTDQDAGARLGRAVGTAIYKNNLRPKHGNDRHDDVWDDD